MVWIVYVLSSHGFAGLDFMDGLDYAVVEGCVTEFFSATDACHAIGLAGKHTGVVEGFIGIVAGCVDACHLGWFHASFGICGTDVSCDGARSVCLARLYIDAISVVAACQYSGWVVGGVCVLCALVVYNFTSWGLPSARFGLVDVGILRINFGWVGADWLVLGGANW